MDFLFVFVFVCMLCTPHSRISIAVGNLRFCEERVRLRLLARQPLLRVVQQHVPDHLVEAVLQRLRVHHRLALRLQQRQRLHELHLALLVVARGPVHGAGPPEEVHLAALACRPLRRVDHRLRKVADHVLHHAQVLPRLVCLEQALARPQLDEHRRHCPHVRGVRPAEEQHSLGRTVVPRSDRGALLRTRVRRVVCGAEVDDDDLRRLRGDPSVGERADALALPQHVLRLEVRVDDAGAVDEGDARHKLPRHVAHHTLLVPLVPVLLQQLEQRRPVAGRHDRCVLRVGDARLRLQEGVQDAQEAVLLRLVRGLQRPQHAELLLRRLHEVGLRPHQLHRDLRRVGGRLAQHDARERALTELAHHGVHAAAQRVALATRVVRALAPPPPLPRALARLRRLRGVRTRLLALPPVAAVAVAAAPPVLLVPCAVVVAARLRRRRLRTGRPPVVRVALVARGGRRAGVLRAPIVVVVASAPPPHPPHHVAVPVAPPLSRPFPAPPSAPSLALLRRRGAPAAAAAAAEPAVPARAAEEAEAALKAEVDALRRTVG
eukprot:Rhum_TRINITY_DN14194_c2_g1::Rhum_TRINITY_DN14194_c2_g1_i1::g.71796::m.71796